MEEPVKPDLEERPIAPSPRDMPDGKLIPAAPTAEPCQETPMDIHKPKPVHDFREFLSEITIIVIGVLIALGLEQAVEAWHWHHQIESTEQALRIDLLDTYYTALDRIAVSPCIDRRLDEIAAIVDRAGTTNRLPAVGRLGSPPQWVGNQSTWDSALAGQTAEHFDIRRRRAYAEMFSFDGRMDYDEKREADAWNALYTMVGPGRVVTPEEVAGWRADIGRARQESETMALLSVRFQQLIETSPLGNARKPYVTPARIVASSCGPIGLAPTHYGNSLFADGLAHARLTPIKSGFPSD